MDFTKENPALLVHLSARITSVLNERQKRAVEAAVPYAVGSSTGWVRKSNEDAGLIARLRFVGVPGKNLDVAIVCDGMGGMQHGRLAAQLAVSTFVGRLLALGSADPLRKRVESSLLSAQQNVYDRVQGDGGTTLTAVCVEGTRACIAHVGDSRAYEVDERGRLTQLTRDDTLGAALKRAESDQGDFNRLIQYIGMPGRSDDGSFEPQILELTPSLTRAGFVLTSDGVHGIGKDIADRVAAHAPSGHELVRRLISVADAFGGLDNATAVFIPDHPTQTDGDGPGVSLSLHTPAGESRIWFAPTNQRSPNQPREDIVATAPISGDFAQDASSPETLSSPPPPPPPHRTSAGSKPAPTRSKGKPKKSKLKTNQSQDALPVTPEEQPRLEVFFPEDDGERE